ncbi:MAG TPA: cupin domain-containing protein [Caulobacteraceae bacterium]|jgi:quercetin dioxygenase-like cupin family protein|nr:cupin domain-containing protein [Caulobacteraceae bacterium]
MSGTAETHANESFYVLGETLAPMLTNDMGSAVEIFDTSGPAGGGPPTHRHAWEEVYVVTAGVLDVTVDGKTVRLGPGGFAHVPANTPHSYLTVEAATFLTIVTKGNASKFFRQVSSEVSMNPPDIAGVVRVGNLHGIEFLPPA